MTSRITSVARGAARWARAYPLAPRYRAPATPLRLRSADGTRLAAVLLSGPPDAVASVVLVHGFSNSSRTPEIHRLAHELASSFNVVALDLRGHGRSGGRSTLGWREPDDVDAAVATAAGLAPRLPVVAIGVSLGGAAALVAAGRRPGAVAGVVAVSAPAWTDLSSSAGRRLARWRRHRSGRLLVRVLSGTRLAAETTDSAPEPIAPFVGAIAPGFVVIAHDPNEAVFGTDHANALYDAAQPPKALWWTPGAGHGRSMLTAAFTTRVRAEISERLGNADLDARSIYVTEPARRPTRAPIERPTPRPTVVPSSG